MYIWIIWVFFRKTNHMWIKGDKSLYRNGHKNKYCFLELMCCIISWQNVWKVIQIQFYLQKKTFGRFCAVSAGDEQQLRTCNQRLKNLQLKVSKELQIVRQREVCDTAFSTSTSGEKKSLGYFKTKSLFFLWHKCTQITWSDVVCCDSETQPMGVHLPHQQLWPAGRAVAGEAGPSGPLPVAPSRLRQSNGHK